MDFYHEPVMPKECMEGLNIKPNGIYADATAGGGGHSALIAEKLKRGKLICIDRDLDAISNIKERLGAFENVQFVHGNFMDLRQILETKRIGAIDGVLFDLGVSSYQLDNADRGFSYIKDAPLDMRMDKTSPVSAYDVINKYEEKELADVFFNYGEEKYSRKIASRIVKERREKPIKTTLELVKLIESSIPVYAKKKDSHPAKRVFQAVRIEVNGELRGLKDFIKTLPEILNSKGRIAVITFHSLEDRAIKTAFYELQNPCICPRDLPVCACGRKSAGKAVYKKPVIPTLEEMKRNSRSKSAKLRVFEKE